MTEEDKEEKVRKKIEDFGGLLDEATAKLLIDYEEGRLTPEKQEKIRARIEKLTHSVEEGLILEVDPIKAYTKRNGEGGKLLSIRVALADGREGKITFWDRQIDEVDLSTAGSGERVTLTNCIYNTGKYGLTINTGKGGAIRAKNGSLLYPAVKK